MMKLTKKLNDIKYEGIIAPNTLKLSTTQISNLTKDQIEGREPIYIKSIPGYLNGEGMWMSVKYMNKLKKEGKWK